MAKTRLNGALRDALRTQVRENPSVEVKAGRAAAEEALTAFEDELAAALLKAYPLEEMKILERYGLATLNRYVCICKDDIKQSYVENYQFNSKNKAGRAVLMPYNSATVALTEGQLAMLHAARDKRRNADRLEHEHRAMYESLIDGSKYLEEIWPAASTVRGKFARSATQLTVLSQELVDKIKADNAGGTT